LSCARSRTGVCVPPRAIRFSTAAFEPWPTRHRSRARAEKDDPPAPDRRPLTLPSPLSRGARPPTRRSRISPIRSSARLATFGLPELGKEPDPAPALLVHHRPQIRAHLRQRLAQGVQRCPLLAARINPALACRQGDLVHGDADLVELG